MHWQDPLSPNAKLDRLADSGRRKKGKIKGVAVWSRKWIRMPRALTTTLWSSWRTRRRVCPRRRRRRRSSKGALGWWTPALFASWASTTGSPNCCLVCIPFARGVFRPPPGPLTRDGTRKSNSTAIKHVRKYMCYPVLRLRCVRESKSDLLSYFWHRLIFLMKVVSKILLSISSHKRCSSAETLFYRGQCLYLKDLKDEHSITGLNESTTHWLRGPTCQLLITTNKIICTESIVFCPYHTQVCSKLTGLDD